MKVTTVDMFGDVPGRGSQLDVIIPEGPCDGAVVREIAARARIAVADESALVTWRSRERRAFSSRIFASDGETSLGTHSVAGVAACLVGRGLLPVGDVERIAPDGRARVRTDGRVVSIRFEGSLVHGTLPHVPRDLGVSSGPERAGERELLVGCGVGRSLTLWRVDQDPRSLPPPDAGRMRDLGLTDLTAFRWDEASREVVARVFAPGFGIPEDRGCLPAAASLGAAALRLTSGGAEPLTIRQVTARGTESVFLCEGSVRDGVARLRITSRVWVGTTDTPWGTGTGRSRG